MYTDQTELGLLNTAGVCQNVESARTQALQLPMDVEKMTIKVWNVHAVQFGKSVRLVNEVEPCYCNHSCEPGKIEAKPHSSDKIYRKKHHSCERKQKKLALSDKDARLKTNATPDEAAETLEMSPVFSDRAGVNNDTCVMRAILLEDDEIRDANEARLDTANFIPLIKKQGFLKGFKCEIVLKELEKLQDNGQFEVHEKLASGLLEFYTTVKQDPDMRATLMIERGMAFYYANDSSKCKRLFNAAMRMGDSLVNRDLIEGRALFLKAAAYRREKKFNKALKCLQRADFLLFNQDSGEDKAELYYNYGTLWLDMYSTKSSNDQGRRVLKEEAKKCYERAIEYCTRDERPRVQIKKKRYFNLKLAALNLDCSSKAARKAQIFHLEDVEEAKKRLDLVEYQLGDDMPLGTRIQLLLTRSDQHYRQGNLRLAKQVAEEGLGIAEDINVNSAITPLRARIEELETIEALQPRDREPVISPLSDSGWSGDVSSSD